MLYYFISNHMRTHMRTMYAQPYLQPAHKHYLFNIILTLYQKQYCIYIFFISLFTPFNISNAIYL